MVDLNTMKTSEIEDYLDEITDGTYTCTLTLKKDEKGFGIEVDSDDPHEIVKVMISFGWNLVMDDDDFDMSDTPH